MKFTLISTLLISLAAAAPFKENNQPTAPPKSDEIPDIIATRLENNQPTAPPKSDDIPTIPIAELVRDSNRVDSP